MLATLMRGAVLETEPDWGTLGLCLCVVGAFLLGNAILFRHPRQLVEERFRDVRLERSSARPAPLLGIREQVFHRLQVSTGFFALVGGFVLQIVGRFRPRPADAPLEFPVFGITIVALATAFLIALGWWWSSRVFRRHVRAHLTREPPEFERDPKLAREVGELFGVESRADDTVEAYAARLRAELGLRAPARRGRPTPVEPMQAELDGDQDGIGSS